MLFQQERNRSKTAARLCSLTVQGTWICFKTPFLEPLWCITLHIGKTWTGMSLACSPRFDLHFIDSRGLTCLCIFDLDWIGLACFHFAGIVCPFGPLNLKAASGTLFHLWNLNTTSGTPDIWWLNGLICFAQPLYMVICQDKNRVEKTKRKF